MVERECGAYYSSFGFHLLRAFFLMFFMEFGINPSYVFRCFLRDDSEWDSRRGSVCCTVLSELCGQADIVKWENWEVLLYGFQKGVLCVFCDEEFFWGVPYGKRKIFLFTYDYRHMRISLHYKLWGYVGGCLKSVSFLTLFSIIALWAQRQKAGVNLTYCSLKTVKKGVITCQS